MELLRKHSAFFCRVTRSWLPLFVALHFCAAAICAKDNPKYHFNVFSLKEGLTQTTAHSILRDTDGFLWIGTASGLNRYDGQRLTTYFASQNNDYALPSNRILYVAEDARNRVWVSTNRGVALFDAENNRFLPQKWGEEAFISYAHCPLPDGMVFCSEGALYKYGYESGQWQKLPMNGGLTVDFHFTDAVLWGERELLLSTRHNGLFIYNLATGTVTVASFHTTSPSIISIFLDSQKRLWVAPYGKGLLSYSQSGELLAAYDTRNSALSNDVALDIMEHNGKIWIGTDGGGISILNPDEGTFEHIRHTPENTASFPANSIISLYKDRWQNIWVGSIRNGLIEVSEVSMATYRQTSLGNPFGLSNETIISLLQDNDGSIWIGTDGGGINRLNPQTSRFEHFRASVGDKITSIAPHSPRQLLISVFGEGIFFFDKKTGEKRPLLIVNEDENNRILKSGYTATLHRLDDGTTYIFSDKIYRYNAARQSFSTDSVQRTSNSRGILNKVASDDENRFLYSFFSVYRRTENDIWREILTLPPHETINAAALDARGTLWLGTNAGLRRFNPDADTAAVQAPMQEETAVTALVCDNRNRLWVGTNGTLWAHDIGSEKFTLFGEMDGTTPNEYLARPALVARTGDVYMGGVNGLLFIDKNIAVETADAPRIRLTQLTANNRERYFPPSSSAVPRIGLAWNKSAVTLQVIVQEKDIFRKRMFRYHVSGLARTPIETAEQSLTLQSLPSGNYTVSVSCTLPGGGWSEPHRILTLAVSPPWWKSGWFIALLAVAAVAGISLGVYLFIRKKENALKWQMKEREKEAYEEKVRFLINISHELRTPLTLIYAPLKRMLARLPEKEDLQPAVEGIYKQAANMKQIIDMVLDMRKMETGNEKLHIEPHALHDWIRHTANYFADEMAHHGMELRYDFDPRVGEVPFDKAKCAIVLSNLLSNALKFGAEGTPVTIATELREQEGRVRIKVCDQGAGLAEVDARQLFSHFYQGRHERGGSGIGLAFSKELVQMHGGVIGAQNAEEGAGAVFYFDLPLHQAATEAAPAINALLTADETDLPAEQYPQLLRVNTARYSLLAVEDNAELLAFLKQHFADEFRAVFTATNGEDALEIIRQRQPDIVVSDVVMPRMDGFELCRRVKSDIAISHIPVVLLTARNDQDNVQLGYKLGADAYVAKPFETDFLHTVLQNQLYVREQIKARYKSQAAALPPQEITFSNADEQFVLKLNALIEKHLADPQLNVQFIAAEIGMSRASLYNKMKELLNTGVGDYVNRMRLQKSAELLLSRRDMSIGEVASLCGFSSQRYFSTSFRQWKGVSPSDFRNSPSESASDGSKA